MQRVSRSASIVASWSTVSWTPPTSASLLRIPRTRRLPWNQSSRRVTPSATHRAIDAVWRIESARLIAGLTRIVRDVAVAEDLAQDALGATLEQWPESGVPPNP